MTSDKQLLEQALEALDSLQRMASTFADELHDKHPDVIQARVAVTAIKARLEQPEQEPVAQWQKRHPAETDGKWENTNEHDAKWWRVNALGWEIRALYTTPPGGRQSEDCLSNVATPLAAQEEIQRLSALVRAQQITIDKLEKNCD